MGKKPALTMETHLEPYGLGILRSQIPRLWSRRRATGFRWACLLSPTGPLLIVDWHSYKIPEWVPQSIRPGRNSSYLG